MTTYTTTTGEVWRASPRELAPINRRGASVMPHIVIAELRALRADRDAAIERLGLKLAEIARLSIETEKLLSAFRLCLAALEEASHQRLPLGLSRRITTAIAKAEEALGE